MIVCTKQELLSEGSHVLSRPLVVVKEGNFVGVVAFHYRHIRIVSRKF